jgi:hypothetical protein
MKNNLQLKKIISTLIGVYIITEKNISTLIGENNNLYSKYCPPLF